MQNIPAQWLKESIDLPSLDKRHTCRKIRDKTQELLQPKYTLVPFGSYSNATYLEAFDFDNFAIFGQCSHTHLTFGSSYVMTWTATNQQINSSDLLKEIATTLSVEKLCPRISCPAVTVRRNTGKKFRVEIDFVPAIELTQMPYYYLIPIDNGEWCLTTNKHKELFQEIEKHARDNFRTCVRLLKTIKTIYEWPVLSIVLETVCYNVTRRNSTLSLPGIYNEVLYEFRRILSRNLQVVHLVDTSENLIASLSREQKTKMVKDIETYYQEAIDAFNLESKEGFIELHKIC